MSTKVLFFKLSLLIYCMNSTHAFVKSPNPKIIIIGAGSAGIACAVKLLEYGFEDITLLEAESRIGGRIYTIPYGENVIDLGAQWCHGEEGNVVYELAYKQGLLQHSNEAVTNNFTYARSNAEMLKPKLVERLRNITDYIKVERAKEVSHYNGSMGSYLRHKFEAVLSLPANADIHKKVAQEYYEVFEKEESCDEASDTLNIISSRDYMLFNEIEGDYLLNWKNKGYKEFLQLLLKTNETGKEFGVLDGRIKLSKKVSRIYWQNKNYKTKVKCVDGEEFKADHVIVTASLGVLKAHLNDMFEPALPVEKENAINAVEYGSFNKIILEFAKPFWNVNWGGVYFLWRDEELKELRNSNFSWLEGVYSFNTIPQQSCVLEGWIIGPGARYMEMLTLNEIEAGVMFLFRKFLQRNVPLPINITISNWYSNPNFRGCYSFHSVETEKANATNQQLANPVMANCNKKDDNNYCQKPILQFAGEATETKHYATVHGAVESGYREAQRIRDYYFVEK